MKEGGEEGLRRRRMMMEEMKFVERDVRFTTKLRLAAQESLSAWLWSVVVGSKRVQAYGSPPPTSP